MEKSVVEINGVKMEVDLRTAKRVDQFKVGDAVKVLIKKYTAEYASYPGVIVGFDNFKDLPTIIVCYIETGYASSGMKFAYLNKQTKEIELCAADPLDMPVERNEVLSQLDAEIGKTELAHKDALRKRAYFLAQFGSYFGEYAKEGASVGAHA